MRERRKKLHVSVDAWYCYKHMVEFNIFLVYPSLALQMEQM